MTSLSSLAFITMFGFTCLLAFRQRDVSLVTGVLPAVSVVGAATTAVALLWHLNTAERSVSEIGCRIGREPI